MTQNSTSFAVGDGRVRGPGGRPSPIDDPEFAKAVAEAFAAGLSRPEMCEMFGVKDPNTITRWRRKPHVKRAVLKIAEERIIQITRKIDSKIEGILSQRDDLTIQELIMIRKEFLGGALRAQTEKPDEEVIGEAADWMEKHPDLAAELTASFEKAGVAVEDE